MRRGEIWWASLPSPAGSAPGFSRPVLIVQSDEFNSSRIGTVVVVAITSHVRLARAPGNVRLTRRKSGLPRESVVNVSQVVTLDKSALTGKVRVLAPADRARVEAGLCLVLAL